MLSPHTHPTHNTWLVHPLWDQIHNKSISRRHTITPLPLIRPSSPFHAKDQATIAELYLAPQVHISYCTRRIHKTSSFIPGRVCPREVNEGTGQEDECRLLEIVWCCQHERRTQTSQGKTNAGFIWKAKRESCRSVDRKTTLGCQVFVQS